jgi:hypothetical protein
MTGEKKSLNFKTVLLVALIFIGTPGYASIGKLQLIIELVFFTAF